MALSRKLAFSLLRNNQSFRFVTFSQTAQIHSIQARTQDANLHPKRCSACSAMQTVSQTKSYATTVADSEPGILKKAMNYVWPNKQRVRTHVLKQAGSRAFLCAADLVDHVYFIEALGLPDTFTSYFRVVELHIWMIMVRLKLEGEEGRVMKLNMLQIMWKDLDVRMKKFGQDISYKNRLEALDQYGREYRVAVYSYDEGIMSNDQVLAAAVWRQFFEMKCDDPEKIELVVGYIRKQMSYLDTLDSMSILKTGLIPFLPLKGDYIEDKDAIREKLRQIVDTNTWIW